MVENKKNKILIVDDVPENVSILNGILKDKYSVSVALNGEKAISLAFSKNTPDIILLDVVMPKMDGYEICKKLKTNKKTAHIPIIFVTAMGEVDNEAKGLDIGAVDYIVKPVNPAIVKARVKTHLELKKAREHLKHQNIILEEKVKERTAELTLTQDVTIQSLASLCETRDNETGAHIKRTRLYVKYLAEKLFEKSKYKDFLSHRTIDLLYKSAPLHDIGKVGVPDKILLKPGKLTDEEFDEMKKHTIYGKEALQKAEEGLKKNSFLRLAKEIAYTHHEKWDGSGYPQGLKGEEIPLSGRLMAIADIYDALISKRIYKPAFPHEKAVKILSEEMKNQIDPVIIKTFLEIADNFKEIALSFADNDEKTILLKRTG